MFKYKKHKLWAVFAIILLCLIAGVLQGCCKEVAKEPSFAIIIADTGIVKIDAEDAVLLWDMYISLELEQCINEFDYSGAYAITFSDEEGGKMGSWTVNGSDYCQTDASSETQYIIGGKYDFSSIVAIYDTAMEMKLD